MSRRTIAVVLATTVVVVLAGAFVAWTWMQFKVTGIDLIPQEPVEKGLYVVAFNQRGEPETEVVDRRRVIRFGRDRIARCRDAFAEGWVHYRFVTTTWIPEAIESVPTNDPTVYWRLLGAQDGQLWIFVGTQAECDAVERESSHVVGEFTYVSPPNFAPQPPGLGAKR